MVDDSLGSQRQIGLGCESSWRRSEKKGDASQRSWRLTLKGSCLAPTSTVVMSFSLGGGGGGGGGGRCLSRLDRDVDDDLEAVVWW